MFVEQPTQRGTGDAAAVGMTAFPGDDLDDDSTIVVAARRHAAAAAGDARRARRRARRQRQRGHAAHERRRRPDRLRPGHPRQGRPGRCASSSSATRTPDERGDRTRSARASTRSGATCSARRCATCRPTTPRASTTSPTSIGVLAGMGHRVGCVQAPAEETQGVNDRWQLALAERELRVAHEPPLAAQRRHDARPAPDVHRRHGAARPRRHAVPGHDPAGHAPSSATAARSGPTPASIDCVVGAGLPIAAHRRPRAPRSAPAPGSARTPTCRRARVVAAGDVDRRLLHCARDVTDGAADGDAG